MFEVELAPKLEVTGALKMEELDRTWAELSMEESTLADKGLGEVFCWSRKIS
jgi:hypothetical protein